MKLLIIIFSTILFSSCYTQIDFDHFRHSYHPDEILDSIVFFPDADFELAGGTISDLIKKSWRRSLDEETAVEQIYRSYDYHKIKIYPGKIEGYSFSENGDAGFYSDVLYPPQISGPPMKGPPQLRWRLLISNPNIILFYTVNAEIYRKIRIEELSSDYLKIVVLE